MSKRKAKISPDLIQNLVKLGLTKAEARAYVALLKQGPSTLGELNTQLNVLPPALSRTIKNLQKKKLVVSSRSFPKVAQALPPTLSLEAFLKEKAIALEQVKQDVVKSLREPLSQKATQIDVCLGKNDVFRKATALARKSKKEILIISIGEPTQKELTSAFLGFIKAGGQVKLIVHKYDGENRNLLESWKKMGWQIRHYKDWGYHMGVFDGKICHVSANNPINTDERIAIFFYNPALAKALRSYFYSLWEKAVPI